MIAVRGSHLLALAIGLAAGLVAYSLLEPEPTPLRELPTVTVPTIPDYLAKAPELWMRAGTDIVRAPAADNALAATYARSLLRVRPLVDGRRIAILTASTRVRVGEPVRVIHVLDAADPGLDVYVMGPKAITDERIDGGAGSADTIIPLEYDGAVVKSPHADWNYDITTYTFATPGRHTIVWHLGTLGSNVLEIDVH